MALGQLLLRCGCQVAFHDGEAVICPQHGPQGVARVLSMPKPRITGMASGPLVTPTDVLPWTGRFAGSDKPVKES
jgi:hypothetical protein